MTITTFKEDSREVISVVDTEDLEHVITYKGFNVSVAEEGLSIDKTKIHDGDFHFSDGRWTVQNAQQCFELAKKLEDYAESALLMENPINSKERDLMLALANSYKSQGGMFLAFENFIPCDKE